MKLKFYKVLLYILLTILLISQITACSFTPDPSNDTGNNKTPPEPANLVLTEQLVETVPPAGVRIQFKVQTASGDSPGPLSGSDFIIINDETGKSFQSEGIGRPFLGEATNISFYTVLTLDVSESIRANLLVDVVIDAALAVVNSLLNGQSGSNQQVAVYAFGRTGLSRTWVPFTGQYDLVEQGLENLRITAKSESFGGTNLYNAYTESLNVVRTPSENETILITRSVVLVTDGTHTAGDPDGIFRAKALESLALGDVEVYTVGIQGDYNKDAIRELASRPTNFSEDVTVEDLVSTLTSISNRVLALSNSNYILGVCTPIEFGNPSTVIIEFKCYKIFRNKAGAGNTVITPISVISGVA